MRYFFLIIYIVLSVKLSGQKAADKFQGTVSFISSQNIYVKFKSTDGLSAGDTLYILSNGKLNPVLIINNLSSTSCVCSSLAAKSLSVGQAIVARNKNVVSKSDATVTEKSVADIPLLQDPIDSITKQPDEYRAIQKINGSISAYSYSDFSNTSASNSNRFRYTLLLNARNIASSKFSVGSYISFRHKAGDWSEVRSNVFNALKIYDLDLSYDLNKTTHISIGRKINPKISSIGAMDGLQIEKSFNNFAIGLLGGTRPDYTNYGFNSKLLQYGAYLAYNSVTSDIYNESSLAFMQQMNDSKTDRRFLYFQHSNSVIKNLYFFSTFELDLYKLKNDIPQSTFELTGLNLLLRYKMTKNLSITGSYDARKNVIYYETYKTLIDSVFENEMRQSVRLQTNYHITRDIVFGLQAGYRFIKSDSRPTRNLYGYLTYSQVPGMNISLTLSGTYLESDYMNGKVLGALLSRDLINGKFQTSIGYRYVDYTFPENLQNVVQNIGEMNLYWIFLKNLSFSVNYEGTFEKKDLYNRLFLQLRKRF